MNHLRENYRVYEISGLLPGLSLYSYRVRELLVCWLFFSVLFVCVTLVILSGMLAVHAGEWLTVWARTTVPVTPVLALGSHLHGLPDQQVPIAQCASPLANFR